MRSVLASLLAIWAAGAALASPSGTGGSLNQAASWYHQGRFDSALARLDAMRSEGPWKRRDSLSFFQYSGMASSRLGLDSQAVVHFTSLLALDSLFQFPKNEDPQVLGDFAQAREARRTGNAAAPAALPVMEPAGGFSFSDSGSPPASAPVPYAEGNRKIGLAYGAIPLGAGWLARDRIKQGLVLGLLQGGGLAISMYASQMATREESDAFAIQNERERASAERWQWSQRVSLSAAMGAYLFSLIASAGD